MRARLALRAVPLALLAAAVSLPAATAQAPLSLEAALSGLVSSGYCRAAFAPAGDAPAVPDVTGLSGADACDRVALALGGDWGRVGSVVWFQPPGTAKLRETSGSEPLPVFGPQRTAWRVRGPVREGGLGLASDLTDTRLRGLLTRLVDGASLDSSSAEPATRELMESLLHAALGGSPAGDWKLSGRLLPYYSLAYVEWATVLRMLPGDAPVAAQPVSLPLGVRTAEETARSLARSAGLGEVTLGEGLGAGTVLAVSDGARADEALCALALSAGGSWRQVGDMLFLAPRRAPGGNDAQADDGWSRGLLSLADSDGGDTFSAIDPSRPMLIEGSLGSRGVRIMLHRSEPSRAVLQAVERRFREVASHCLAESVEGFAVGVGRPLAQDKIETLRAATQGQGPLDGNRLIALAKEAGVELVGVKGTLDEIGEKRGVAIVHLTWGHYIAVTDCDSAFVTLLGADGRRARFPKDALESGMSGIMFVAPELLDERPAALRSPGGLFGIG